MSDVNNRFIEFYNYILSQNIVSNGKEFAKKIEVSPSLITEITKGRSIVGTKVIQNSVINFDLNSDWLFTGDGKMLKNSLNTVVKAVDNEYILRRFEELVSENTLLKKEVEDLRYSRGKSVGTTTYNIGKKSEAHIAAEPGERGT